jgi:hypothetical protein
MIRTALQAGARKRQRDHLSDIISGPATTYRSELIEASYTVGDRIPAGSAPRPFIG